LEAEAEVEAEVAAVDDEEDRSLEVLAVLLVVENPA